MKIDEIARTLDAKVISAGYPEDLDIKAACGADLMSDVMAFVKDDVALLTGLVNPQVVRTAEIMDIRVIIFVRGKYPTPDIVKLAAEREIVLLSTRYPMFISCGRLYAAGLTGGGTREIPGR
jgi:predicted transcriptional regulator